MDIILYNISSPPNRVNKVLGTGVTIENVRFTEKNSLNVINPTIILNLGDELSDITKYNYVKIPKFTRYYWIENIECNGGLAYIQCKVDPLMSFKSDIIGSTQYVSRSETSKNSYMVDHLLPMTSKHHFAIHPFGDTVYDENCINVILETTGKGGNVDNG